MRTAGTKENHRNGSNRAVVVWQTEGELFQNKEALRAYQVAQLRTWIPCSVAAARVLSALAFPERDR